MLAVFAAGPIALTLVLMMGLGWSAARAGAVGAALAAVLAATTFDAGGHGEAALFLGVTLEAGFIALTILWILWPALAIHALQERMGTLERLREAIMAASSRPVVPIVLVAFFFGLFFEGAAGFGTPVALAAPLLVGLGLPAERALVFALVGHAAGVSFGAIGTPVAAQAALVGLDAQGLAAVPALLTASAAWLLLARVSWHGRSPAVTVVAYGAFVAPFLAVALLLGPALPTLAGALIGGTVFVAVHVRPDWRAALRSPLWRAGAPYLALVGLVGVTQAIPVVRETLAGARLAYAFGDAPPVTFTPLLHPGTLLAIAFLSGAIVQSARGGDVVAAARAAARKLVPVAGALFAMLFLARTMVHADMVGALADGLARAVGLGWPLAAASVGAIGTFVTGSATASNLLFSELQASVASRLGLSAPLILGAQTFGAAAGNMIAPHNIVAGCATVGLVGREGAVLRATLPITLAYAALGSLFVLAFAIL